MRILVTGAAGFIGSHAVDVMRAAGHEVQGLDSLTPAVHTGRPDYLPDNFDLAVGTSATRTRSAGRWRARTSCATRPPWSASASTWPTCPPTPT